MLLAACATSAPEPRPSARPELVSTREIPGSFLLRQQVEFRAGERSGSFEAVVQKRCDELVVIGFTPFGQRAFSVRQRGTEVDAEVHVPGAWPFPPEYILLDIHRAYLVPLPTHPPEGGVRETRYGSESLSERWAAGRLTARRFRSGDDGQEAGVVIRYGGEAARVDTPGEVFIENRELGYEIEVSTLSRIDLECP
jgi:hypothetical protein